MKQIAVLAEGAWGTAIATVLAHNGYAVKLWCHNKELVDQINQYHENTKYLPAITLSTSIIAVATIQEAVAETDLIFEAVPVKYLRLVLLQAQSSISYHQRWVMLSKGIEQDTGFSPSQIIEDLFGSGVKIAAISGPSFAHDVALKQTTGFVIASSDTQFAREIQEIMASDYIDPRISTDLIGVQACGAFKNVVTLALGMAAGAGLSDTTRAFILTRGLQEMVTFVTSLGGHIETVYGLAGVGDLVMTAYSDQSKNRQVGIKIGQGLTLDQILAQTGYIPEGVNTLSSILHVAQAKKVSLPFCQALHEVIFNGASVQDLIKKVTA